jgi:hypothetical protein
VPTCLNPLAERTCFSQGGAFVFSRRERPHVIFGDPSKPGMLTQGARGSLERLGGPSDARRTPPPGLATVQDSCALPIGSPRDLAGVTYRRPPWLSGSCRHPRSKPGQITHLSTGVQFGPSPSYSPGQDACFTLVQPVRTTPV